MSGTYDLVVGDKGRVVAPARVREGMGLSPGTPLVLLETAGGLVLVTRRRLRDRVRRDLAGADLVGELPADRRRAAGEEDAG